VKKNGNRKGIKENKRDNNVQEVQWSMGEKLGRSSIHANNHD
jgi:hypothetical protein